MPRPVLDLDLLRAFVVVAQHRSFTRAAARLHRTQSAVSMQIKRLEARLGVVLFHRGQGRVELTAAGAAFLADAGGLLRLHDEAVDRLREHGTEGVVRLGVMEDYGTSVLPPLLARFAAAHPRVHVALQTGLTTPMLDRLDDSFDLVIAMHPAGRGDGTFLCREQAVWATGLAVATEAQDPLPVALYPPGCLFRRWATEALEAAHRSWRLAFVSPSLAAVASMAAEGSAVTVVKAGMLSPRLRRLSDRDGLPRLPAADICLHRAARLDRPGSLLADHLAAATWHGVR